MSIYSIAKDVVQKSLSRTGEVAVTELIHDFAESAVDDLQVPQLLECLNERPDLLGREVYIDAKAENNYDAGDGVVTIPLYAIREAIYGEVVDTAKNLLGQ